jgi:phage tail sheath protein FI
MLMSLNLTYPGVYIQELDSGVRTITGVSTSVTAFIGRALRGPTDEPTRIFSFADYQRTFGGLWAASPMSFSVRQFFLNGGSEALIVRVYNPPADGSPDRAGEDLAAPGNPLRIEASSPGEWGANLWVGVDYQTRDESDTSLFNLTVQERDVDKTTVLDQEQHRNLTLDPTSSRFVTDVLREASDLVRVGAGPLPSGRPTESPKLPSGAPDLLPLTGGNNGQAIGSDQIIKPDLEGAKKGLWALEKADLFNLLCIPPYAPGVEVAPGDWNDPAKYCRDRRAVLLVDPPQEWDDTNAVVTNYGSLVSSNRENAALYFPWICAPNPLKESRLEPFAPSGAVAGVIARIDATRGVWKAPAGQEATLAGVQELEVTMTDKENGVINPLGVNALRTFRVAGRVVWGARTLAGADQLASQWKYLPVRRLALYIEESLYRGTQWVVFEPNDEPLWSQIRLNLGAFMHDLFRQGAFQGTTPREAYFVKCDRETTTQSDIDRGIVNIIVGFAPLKPAEFVVIKIQQIARQAEV